MLALAEDYVWANNSHAQLLSLLLKWLDVKRVTVESIAHKIHYLWLIFITLLRTQRNVLSLRGPADDSDVCLRIISEQQNNSEGDQCKILNLWIFICFSHEFSLLTILSLGIFLKSIWPPSQPSNMNDWRHSTDSHLVTSNTGLIITLVMCTWEARSKSGTTGQLSQEEPAYCPLSVSFLCIVRTHYKRRQ